jgi:hypothetical protein
MSHRSFMWGRVCTFSKFSLIIYLLTIIIYILFCFIGSTAAIRDVLIAKIKELEDIINA